MSVERLGQWHLFDLPCGPYQVGVFRVSGPLMDQLAVEQQSEKDAQDEYAQTEGLYIPQERAIYLREGIGDLAEFETLMHECCHAILHLSGLDKRLGVEEETLCQTFGLLLSQMFYSLSPSLKKDT